VTGFVASALQLLHAKPELPTIAGVLAAPDSLIISARMFSSPACHAKRVQQTPLPDLQLKQLTLELSYPAANEMIKVAI
jgi:hypothetical protein